MLKKLVIPASLTVFSVAIIQNSVAASEKPAAISLEKTQSNLLLAQAETQEKPRIAVIDFDFSSVGSPNLLSLIPGGADGVADLLVTGLVQSDKYTVVERSEIETILAEQNLGASGRVDASTAAEIGRILGVNAVIIGSVTQFDLQQQSGGGGAFGIGARTQKTTADVAIDVRVVDTNTAEILHVAQGSGSQNQSDSQVSVFGINAGASTSNEGKLLTLATEQAVKEISDSMKQEASNIAALQDTLPQVDAVVASVSGNTVVLNKGNNDRYREGMTVSIERVTEEVKDPETGEVIRQLTAEVGTVELTDVDGKSSLGKLVSGSLPKVGDVAKPVASD